MAQSAATALKETFAEPTVSGLEPVIRGQMLHPQADNDDEVFEEDLEAINAAVNELIRLEARGQRLSLTVEDVKTYEALETIAGRFREFGLSHRFSETIINAIEECAINNGTNFARKNRSEILSVRIEITDKKPELTKGRSHFMIAFDGQQKHAAKYSTVEIHYTNVGTKTTTTSMPDLENMFVNKTKYLVFTYEGREAEALDSPANVMADLSAVAANGAIPAETVEQLQTAIENGTITADQVELIQATAELGRVMELTAIPGALENPAATVERLQTVVAEALQSSDIPPALAGIAEQSVRKMEILVSSPEFSALVTQGTPIDVVAFNDNETIVAETTDVKAQEVSAPDAEAIVLTVEQQATLQDFIQQSDLPAAEVKEILAQVSEGTLDRAVFEKIETVALEAGKSLPDAVVATVAEIKEISSTTQTVQGVDVAVALSEPQIQALQELIQKQDIPVAEREQILAQIEQGLITRDIIAKIEQAVADVAMATPVLAELKQELVRQTVPDAAVAQVIQLSEPQKAALEQIIQQQDMSAADRTEILQQIEKGTITAETLGKIEQSSADITAPVIAEIKDSLTAREMPVVTGAEPAVIADATKAEIPQRQETIVADREQGQVPAEHISADPASPAHADAVIVETAVDRNVSVEAPKNASVGETPIQTPDAIVSLRGERVDVSPSPGSHTSSEPVTVITSRQPSEGPSAPVHEGKTGAEPIITRAPSSDVSGYSPADVPRGPETRPDPSPLRNDVSITPQTPRGYEAPRPAFVADPIAGGNIPSVKATTPPIPTSDPITFVAVNTAPITDVLDRVVASNPVVKDDITALKNDLIAGNPVGQDTIQKVMDGLSKEDAKDLQKAISDHTQVRIADLDDKIGTKPTQPDNNEQDPICPTCPTGGKGCPTCGADFNVATKSVEETATGINFDGFNLNEVTNQEPPENNPICPTCPTGGKGCPTCGADFNVATKSVEETATGINFDEFNLEANNDDQKPSGPSLDIAA